jgi:death-on-curing protein
MLGAQYVEYIHDELVAKLWPETDPVTAGEYRSNHLLESAVGRPFHSAFGKDSYPTMMEKAAALFHSLISNHPFYNGNKRTAVLAFDLFLLANGYFGFLGNDAMYKLAQQTASYKERGLSPDESFQEILDAVRDWIAPLSALRKAGKANTNIARLYDSVKEARRRVRRNKLNRRMNVSS